MEPIEVAAGLVFRDGRVLIARRPAGGHLAGLWEFPGGKCEAGETMVECLQRELQEELGIAVKIGERVEKITHRYQEKTVTLFFFRCDLVSGELRGREGQAVAWVRAGELENYNFPEADARLLERLKANPDWWE